MELRREGARRRGSSPWIRRRDVARIFGPPDPTALARVIDHRGVEVGVGLFSPESELVVRLLSRDGESVPEDWLPRRVAEAVAARAALGLGGDTTGYRVINSEGDRLPGLVLDRYGDAHVAQLGTAPMVARKSAIAQALGELGIRDVTWIVTERAARREGVAAECSGARPERLSFREHGLAFACPAPPTQKTGAYLDQRENRVAVARLAAASGGALLDLGCHVGGFSIHAAARGVRCVAVDSSAVALEWVRGNAAGVGEVQAVPADLFGALDDPRLAGPFSTIVLDPPKTASNARDRQRAIAALGGVVRRLAPRLSPLGVLVVCSCSHHVGAADLEALVRGADAVSWTRIAAWGPGPDHPVWPGHAEGHYLTVHAYQRRG